MTKNKPQIMRPEVLNVCQVSLKNNIPLILENFRVFKNNYDKIKIFIICPKVEINEFKEKLGNNNFEFIDEEDLISFREFKKIFHELSINVSYRSKFEDRLRWYYQQILKISFVLKFIINKNEKIIIWDADTILLKKINFFKQNISIKYGTINEFHKEYFLTNECLIGKSDKYFISFLTQFVAISQIEGENLIKNLNKKELAQNLISETLSRLILNCIFTKHETYNGSMFSEYEFIGQLNYNLNYYKQKPILSLRFGLNGKLTTFQILISKFLNFKHITYEHSHPNNNSKGMLDRKQTWLVFLKILLKNLIKFYLRAIRHNFRFYFR